MPIWKRRLFETHSVSRVEIRPGFGRWWFTYVVPIASGILAALVAVLALSEWLPQLFSLGVSSPNQLRFVGGIVFLATYILSVLAMRKWFRKQDSEFSE
jgi:hypothetical protein